MGCCEKRKQVINNHEITNVLYNDKLVPDISASEPQSNRISARSSIDSTANISLDDFKTLKILGKGSFGKVYLVKNINTDKI